VSDHSLNSPLIEDAFAQAFPDTGQLQRPSDIETQIPDAKAKGHQALDRRKTAMPRSWVEFGLFELICEPLKITQGDLSEVLATFTKEPLGIGSVRSLGVAAPTMKPKLNQLCVAVSLPPNDIDLSRLNRDLIR